MARSCAPGEDIFELVLIVSGSSSCSHRFSCVSDRRVFIPLYRAMTKCRLIFSAERDTAKHKFARRGVTLGAAGLYGGSSSRRRRRLAY